MQTCAFVPGIPARLQHLRRTPAHDKCRPRMVAPLARARQDVATLQRWGAQVGKCALAAVAAGLIASGGDVAIADVPDLAPGLGLTDETGLVQRGNASLFNKAMSGIETRDGVRVRFLLVKSVPYGVGVDEYAAEVAGKWGLGGGDVLFVASPKLARAGVYVSGVERLTDEIAESVANDTYAVAAGEERYGSALLDVSNRLIPVLDGLEDPGKPVIANREGVSNFKTKEETKEDRNKYVTVVGTILVISVVAPLIQTYWYVRDD